MKKEKNCVYSQNVLKSLYSIKIHVVNRMKWWKTRMNRMDERRMFSIIMIRIQYELYNSK